MMRPHGAQAACAVTYSGTVDCDAPTKTTATINTNGAQPNSSDRTQQFDNGAPATVAVRSGIALSGAGLAIIEAPAGEGPGGAPAPISMTNYGQVTTGYPGNAVQLSGNGGTITYSGNGSIVSTNTATNGAPNGGAALDVGNVFGSIGITTGSGAISGAQGIDASTTQGGAISITTGAGAVTGTVAQGILAASGAGPISVTVGSGGVRSAGHGSAAISATSNNGDISIVANGAVTGGAHLDDPPTAPPAIIATSNGAGNIVIGGAGAVTGPAGRGIWANQSETGAGGILITGAGATAGLGGLCPGSANVQMAIQTGQLGCSGIRAEIQNPADRGNITVNRSGNITGTSAAVDARTAGQGNVTVNTGLNAQVYGQYGFGLEAKSDGTGSIAVATAGAQSSITTGGTGIIVINNDAAIPASAASTITVNTQGTITSTANPISLRNENNPLGVLAGISAGYLGGAAKTPNPNVNGGVSINNSAAMHIASGDGILAYDFGRGSISVTNSGAIVAPTGIALAGSGGAKGTITNSGDIAARVAIDTSGMGAPTTINQRGGAVTGNIVLSAHGDTVNITGGTLAGNIFGNSEMAGMRAGTVNFAAASFTTGGTIDVADINVNSGKLILANSVTVFDRLTNSATMALGAGGPHTITGDYAQNPTGALSIVLAGPYKYGALTVTGVGLFAIGTTLDFDFQFAPTAGEAFTFFNSLSGINLPPSLDNCATQIFVCNFYGMTDGDRFDVRSTDNALILVDEGGAVAAFATSAALAPSAAFAPSAVYAPSAAYAMTSVLPLTDVPEPPGAWLFVAAFACLAVGLGRRGVRMTATRARS